MRAATDEQPTGQSDASATLKAEDIQAAQWYAAELARDRFVSIPAGAT